jgi:hypothetical protein
MYTNNKDISLPIAVWLAAPGGYDLKPAPNTISATSILKPIKALVLGKKVLEEDTDIDISDLIASKLGTAVHTDIENAWVFHHKEALTNLGYPEHVIDRMVVNPTHVTEEMIPVYVEKRTEKEIDGYIISGKFDLVINGVLHDTKTTKTYSYIKGTNNREYTIQGSIYRWLNQDIITEDYLTIEYLFTDWSPYEALANSDYPQNQTVSKRFPFLSLQETEEYLRQRIALYKENLNKDQLDMPQCSPVELWQEPTIWAYYKNPNKTSKSTKNFDRKDDAYRRYSDDGAKGLIVERPGKVKRCKRCAAVSICLQAKELANQGLLK